MMFIPALLVMLVDWNSSRQHLAILDGPGLENSFDASLNLARRVLDEKKEQALVEARLLASQVSSGAPTSKTIWWKASRDNVGDWVPGGNSGLMDFPGSDLIQKIIFEDTINPRRWNSADGVFMVAGAPLKDQFDEWIIVAQPISADLDLWLNEVARGGAGVRQLRYFYSRLLRSNLVVTLGALVFLLLVVSLVLSHRLARYIAEPIKELSLGTEKVAGGDFSHQVEVAAPDELGSLVEAFNQMTRQLLKGKEDLRRAERIAAWQGVARRLAHEIKNPLTPITLAMHRIGKKSDNAVITSCVNTVLEEASNLGRIADEFSMYAQLPQPSPELVSAKQMKNLLESLAQFYLARTRVAHKWEEWPEKFLLWVDPGQLRQVLSNLIKNGNEAMAGDGCLVFDLALVSAPEMKVSSDHSNSWVRFTIRDTGPGFKANAEDIFEPYVTSKATGTGLGLAVSRRMIEDNGGCLWAESTSSGAAFIIDLPNVEGIDKKPYVAGERNSP